MSTSPYLYPDLTGLDPECHIVGESWTLYRTGQKITFSVPVYEDGLLLVIGGLVQDVLVKGVDWTITDDDIDDNAMAMVLTQDPTFTKRLLRSITILKTVSIAAPLAVSLTYHRLYPTVFNAAVADNQLVEVTPELVLELIARVTALQQAQAGVADTTGLSVAQPRLLALDANKENANNAIVGEDHTVNTFDRRNIIRPVQGAFFGDSIRVDIPVQQRTLVRDVDYILVEADIAKTKTSNNRSGVYTAIQLTTAYAGTVRISYHAYGGVVSINDATTMNSKVDNVIDFLQTTDFLTPAGIGNIPLLRAMLARLTTLEDNMRLLVGGGYSDVTTGSAYLRRFRANDAQHHWWSIAQLYRVDGTQTIVTADRMRFRLQCGELGLMADVAVTVDLTAAVPLRVEACNVLQDLGYTPYGVAVPTPVVMPQFRVVWVHDVGVTSGAYLQIGMPLPSLADTVAIEDLSGQQSCWRLLPGDNAPILPSDNAFTLPDGTSQWDSASPTAKSVTQMMPNGTGYLAWAGSKPLSDFTDTGVGSVSLTHLLPATFRIEDVTSVMLDIMDTAATKPFRVHADVIGLTEDVRQARIVIPTKSGATYVYRTLVVNLISNNDESITLSALSDASVTDDTGLALRYLLVKI